jgi:hypothetical protein
MFKSFATTLSFRYRCASYSDWIFNFNAERPARAEEKRLATWGTDVPDGLVVDKKRLVEALKKGEFEDLLAFRTSASSFIWYYLGVKRLLRLAVIG